MMQTISIYDLDKTITRRATFAPFLMHVAKQRPWRFLMFPLLALTTLGYALGLVDRGRLKELNLALVLGRRIDSRHLAIVSRDFAAATLAHNCLKGALARLAADRAEGRRIILATASYQFYVVEIAHVLGIADVVATKATVIGENTSPAIDGENCYGPAKLRMVAAWMVAQGIVRADTHIRFYSDHVSDAPCLFWADEGFATNAHTPLRRLADEHGWTIFDWR